MFAIHYYSKNRKKICVNLYKKYKKISVLPCLLFVMNPIFATSGFPTPGWVTAIGAVFVIVVMVAAAGAGIIREVMTHLLIIGQIATFKAAFWLFIYFSQIINKQKISSETLVERISFTPNNKEKSFQTFSFNTHSSLF